MLVWRGSGKRQCALTLGEAGALCAFGLDWRWTSADLLQAFGQVTALGLGARQLESFAYASAASQFRPGLRIDR
jgi:hypothetical protein